MKALNEITIFISYAWKFSSHYWMLVDWFMEEASIRCSVPDHDTLLDKASDDLKEKITEQIRSAQVVVVLAGLYSAHRGWIDYVISEARRMNKPIVGVRSWNGGWIPVTVKNALTTPAVSWNKASVVKAVKEVF